MKGYVASFHPEDIHKIRSDEAISFVEQDQVVHASEVETNAPWGLARISHHALPNDVEMHHYSYADADGMNVTSYIVDTGSNINHVEFEDRGRWGATIPEGDEDVDGEEFYFYIFYSFK